MFLYKSYKSFTLILFPNLDKYSILSPNYFQLFPGSTDKIYYKKKIVN